MKYLRKTIGLLGLCPSCLRYQGIFTFTDYVCSVCYENEKDGGAFKKIGAGLAIAGTLGFGGQKMIEIKNENTQLQEKLGAMEEQIKQPVLGGIQDKDGDGRITKWDKDNGLPALYNPKYWSQ